jgi:hypothetical protein
MVVALVFAMTGGALAAGHYLITSTKQISPKVLKSLRGKSGPRGRTGAAGPAGRTGRAGTNGTDGTDGTDGTGPAIEVTDTTGVHTSSTDDAASHAVATLPIPAAGAYTATAKVTVQQESGSLDASMCSLIATTTGQSGAVEDDAFAAFNYNDGVNIQTLPLEVSDTFSGPGQIVLFCSQDGSGALFSWDDAVVIATRVTSVTNTAVTH